MAVFMGEDVSACDAHSTFIAGLTLSQNLLKTNIEYHQTYSCK